MSDTYTEIYYHLVWATKRREEMVTLEVEAVLYPCLKAICREKGVTIHALNAMPNHLHLACSLPANIALSDLVQRLKGSSAHLINHLPGGRLALAWQPGYGALTFAGRDLPRVTAYIQNQQNHHCDGKLSEKMERVADD
jgi:putative transposase